MDARSPLFVLAVLVLSTWPALAVRRSRSTHLRQSSDRDSCVSLTNRGTYSVVEAKVGTPPQSFSVVADTGSNHFLVASCLCAQSGTCSARDHCFRGTNRSSSFALSGGQSEDPPSMMLAFGSGKVSAVIATDQVQVGQREVVMKDSLLLMIRNYLRLPGPFEGILGLGIPGAADAMARADRASTAKESGSVEGLGDEGNLEQFLRDLLDRMGAGSKSSAQHARAANEDEARAILQAIHHRRTSVQPKSFLEMADIGSFSMCFNEGTDGVLRFDPAHAAKYLGSTGTLHWGLDLQGISVGAKAKPAILCAKGKMAEGQRSRCGIIPDSGTTNIMGPTNQVADLLAGLCDQWPRCLRSFTSPVAAGNDAKVSAERALDFENLSLDSSIHLKATLFKSLLADCERWLANSTLHELPPIRFQIAGMEGNSQTLELSAWAYVTERSTKALGGKAKVCSPAISEMDYMTSTNGPVWIMGTPLFYEFQVGYALDRTPPAMSLTSIKESPCGTCGKKASLIASSRQYPRRMFGQPRVPVLDTSMPF